MTQEKPVFGEWRPIETAPTPTEPPSEEAEALLLLRSPSGEYARLVSWHTKKGWHNPLSLLGYKPFMWMPLPEFPKEGSL